jgi:integrase
LLLNLRLIVGLSNSDNRVRTTWVNTINDETVRGCTSEQPDIFPFSYDEAMKIVASVDSFYRPYVVARFFTGMRAGEIDALEWSDYKTDMKPKFCA